jgi:hypothetical protein
MKTGPLLFLEPLVTCYEHAAGGLCNVKLLIVGVMSGRFS